MPGRSLVPLLEGRGDDWPDVVYGEYLAEGAAGPLVMIRRGALKYVVGEDSPAQLFDLNADPRELTDLADDPAYRDRAAAFETEVRARWDFAMLKEHVLIGQRRRRAVFDALKRGRHAPWDFEPRSDPSRLYARNVSDILGDLERRARLPRAEEPPPDGPKA